MVACSPLRGVGGILRIVTLLFGGALIVLCFSWTGGHGRYSFPVVPWFLFSTLILIFLMVDCCPSEGKIQTDWLGHFLGGTSILIQESLLCTDLKRCTVDPKTEEYIFLAMGFAQGLLYLTVGYFVLRGPPKPKVDQTPPEPVPPKMSMSERAAALNTPRD